MLVGPQQQQQLRSFACTQIHPNKSIARRPSDQHCVCMFARHTSGQTELRVCRHSAAMIFSTKVRSRVARAANKQREEQRAEST